jgi:hypothetical protein
MTRGRDTNAAYIGRRTDAMPTGGFHTCLHLTPRPGVKHLLIDADDVQTRHAGELQFGVWWPGRFGVSCPAVIHLPLTSTTGVVPCWLSHAARSVDGTH